MHQQNEQPHSSPFSPKSPQPEMSISLESPIKRRPTPTNSPIDEDSIEHSTRSDFDSTSIYSSAIELPSISDDGRLDWSGRGLNKLPRQKSTTQIGPAIQKPIRTLNISKNSLRSIDLANLPMEECTTIDASQNEFSQLRSFHPIAHSLLHLDLSDNRINTIAALNSFSNLQSLDLSHNRIEVFPQLDQLTKLISLNLNSNHLKAIPNLSQLKMLTELSIHGNSLRTLDGIQALLPSQCLRFLDLGANLINDLTEMVNLQGFKALESLTILGNNCTESGHPKFSYRPFIYSCVLGELKILDGSCLSEPEIIKGELLHAQGDARSFRSQSNRHEKLCEYLSRQCPLVSAETQFANDEKLKKVIQKRREYNRRGNQQQILEPSVAVNQPENDGNGRIGKENAIETGNENGMNEKPNKLNGKMPTIPPKMTSASLSPSPIVTTPKSRQRPMSRFNTAAVLSPSQQNRGSPLLVGMGNRIVRTPISAVVNAKNRQQQTMQQDKSKIENQCPQQKECQKPKEGRKEEEEKQPADYSFTISSNSTNLAPTSSSSAASGTSSSSSSKLSSTTVIISKREEEKIEAPSKNNPNEFKSTEQKTTALAEGRGKPTGGIVPHWPPPTTTQTPINNLRLPIRTKNAAVIIANQSSTTTMDFDNASTSTCGLFNAFSFNKNAQKKKNGVGGLRSVLARKLRRSSGKQFPPPNLSASSTSHSTFTDATATRLQQMQKRVDHLAKQNSMLISVNEGNVATFQQLTQKIQHLEAVIAHQTKQMGKICELLAPTPFKLKYERLEEEEKDKLLVSWENGIPLLMKPAPVDYYELFLNDQSAGQVLARSRRLLITDINPEEGIKVSVQAVGEYGHSAKGEIFVPPFPSSVAITAMMADNADDEGEEGKENHHEKRKAEQE